MRYYRQSILWCRSLVVLVSSRFFHPELEVRLLIVLTSILGQPFAAQLADTTSRPTAYAISLTLYVVGFIVVASANGVAAIAAG